MVCVLGAGVNAGVVAPGFVFVLQSFGVAELSASGKAGAQVGGGSMGRPER